jgi:rhodanese-related sulfurtransferase/DNA-directed RNA polymerase subunit RPC12/RpoP
MKRKIGLSFLLLTSFVAFYVYPEIKGNPLPASADQYVCMPCGRDCDKEIVTTPGTCEHCGMKLVKKSSVIFKQIYPENLCEYINTHPKIILLDVRTKKEFDGKSFHDYGTLKNAINIPIQELASRLKELETNKNKEIIVYCSHSQRSSEASYLLTQNGFKNVTNMAKGMSELKDNSCKK